MKRSTIQQAAVLCSARASELTTPYPHLGVVDLAHHLETSHAAFKLALSAFSQAWFGRTLIDGWSEAASRLLNGERV